MSTGRLKEKKGKLVIVGLPMVGVLAASLLPIQPWMHQALVGIAILWTYVTLLSGGIR